jgi:hypothetical protein
MCAKIEEKEKVLVPKVDNLLKHGGRRKVVGTILSVCKTREFLCEQRVYICKKKNVYMQLLVNAMFWLLHRQLR